MNVYVYIQICTCICICISSDDLPVCGFKTSPCARSKSPRVYRHHAHMFQHMCVWCQHTRGRFECTHGGVSESTYGFSTLFSVPQHTQTHTHTKHTPRPPTTPRPQRHTTQHTTSHRDRDRERRQRKKTRQDKTGQDRTGQDRTGQEKTGEDGRRKTEETS